jgi:hypothetical protein
METAIVVVATLVSLGASVYMFILNNLKDLKDNWVLYRCNPAYMPFAGLVGQDPFTNFTNCTMKNFQDYSGFVVDPIMSQFQQSNEVMGEIAGSMNDMRSMMSQTRTGFLGLASTVFGKIENLMSQIQYIIIRMRTLMARTVGIMMSFVYIFTTGQQTGPAVMNGPIGKTMSFLCFDPETPVELHNGKRLPMRSLMLGMILKDGQTVTSIYDIDGEGVDMYEIDGIKVSGSHKVFCDHRYVKARFHPDGQRIPSFPRLSCINTSNHILKLNNTHFMDFVETTDPEYTTLSRNMVETYYNHKLLTTNTLKTPVHTYASGFLGTTLVCLKDKDVMLSEVKVGDVLNTGVKVRGVVRHTCPKATYGQVDDGLEGHLGSWVFKGGSIWTVESFNNFIQAGDVVFYNLITDNSAYYVKTHIGHRTYKVLDELETSHWFVERFKNTVINQ